MKKALNLLGVLLSTRAKKNAFQRSDDFRTLMGFNASVWKFVKTQKDHQNIEFFARHYEENNHLRLSKAHQHKIPKVIHFIWVGPHPLPKEALGNISSWIEKHPDWIFKFWTDRRRARLDKKMEQHFVSDFNFKTLGAQYKASDSYAEKSDLLRYEILYQEGGLYVDHDVQCFESFDTFHEHFDLYCGLEPPHEPVLDSSISVNNNIIGTRSRHPILERAIKNVEERWNKVFATYPGSDKESVIYRVAERSWSSFGDSVVECVGKGETRDIAFPAAYFNNIDDQRALFAHHQYASTWFADETTFEKNVRRRLVSISRKINQILLFNAVLLTVNLAFFIVLGVQLVLIHKKVNPTKQKVEAHATYMQQAKIESVKASGTKGAA